MPWASGRVPPPRVVSLALSEPEARTGAAAARRQDEASGHAQGRVPWLDDPLFARTPALRPTPNDRPVGFGAHVPLTHLIRGLNSAPIGGRALPRCSVSVCVSGARRERTGSSDETRSCRLSPCFLSNSSPGARTRIPESTRTYTRHATHTHAHRHPARFPGSIDRSRRQAPRSVSTAAASTAALPRHKHGQQP